MLPVRIQPENIDTLNAWCRGHSMQPFPIGWLPPTGFWIPEVIAGFMYQTDSWVAFVEDIISNPSSSAEARREGMVLLSEAIENEAAKLGFRYLVGLTKLQSVARAGLAREYVISDFDHATMVKTLLPSTKGSK